MQRNRINFIVAIIAFVIFLGVYIKMERYTIVAVSDTAYKLDRLTGQTWVLVSNHVRKNVNIIEVKVKQER